MVVLELIIRHRARRVLSSARLRCKSSGGTRCGTSSAWISASWTANCCATCDGSEASTSIRGRHFPRLITSIDFLKRERPLRLFRETLPAEGESLYPRRYDILIFDEAHNCAPSGRGKYATDSLRTQALRALVAALRAQDVPDGHAAQWLPREFSALLELLDDQRFARGTIPDRKQLGAVMVRRLKSELPPKFDGSPRFPKRTIDPIEVPYTAEEKAIHAALKKYSELRKQNVGDNTAKLATEFVLLTLKKRLFSSPAAFATTLEKQKSRSVLPNGRPLQKDRRLDSSAANRQG